MDLPTDLRFSYRSDVYGRRFLILLPLIGTITLEAVFTVIALIEDLPPDYLLFESLQVRTQYIGCAELCLENYSTSHGPIMLLGCKIYDDLYLSVT